MPLECPTRQPSRTGTKRVRRGSMSRVRSCSAVLLMGVFGAGAILAQSERATITGTVHDSSGAVVPAANVKITNEATNVTILTTSNVSGEFTVPDLPTGKYDVRVEKGGF